VIVRTLNSKERVIGLRVRSHLNEEMIMKRPLYITLSTIMIFALSCATTGPGGKKDFIIISDAQEVSLGQEFDKQVRADNTILADQEWQNYFDEVGQKIVNICDRPNLEYHFTVIESDDINAFATPGGYVYIYTGLLDLMETEAQLAAVTAHEVSHVVARHGVKRLQQALGLSILLEIVAGESDSQTLMTAINLGLAVALSGYSRENEREADKFGIYYMTLAGFNPKGATNMFERMASVSEGKRNFFESLLSSHPETQERIENADEQVSAYPADILNRDVGRQKYERMKARLSP
jgi:predicted Zn-dependent protease